MTSLESVRRTVVGGGEGALRVAILSDAAAVTAALEQRAMTVAELAEHTGFPLRKAYRLLRALQAAGFNVEERPDKRRSVKDGRVPCVYRMRRGRSARVER
jgi:predicted transcriptional regulator